MKNKAVIIDMYSHGSYHEVINQAYLMMVSDIYKEVTYIADKSSCENLRSLLAKCNFNYSNVRFVEKNISHIKCKSLGLTYLIKLIKVSILNFIYYNKCDKDEDVFYNNNLFFAIILISLFSKKRKNIYILCHNEMELIDKKSSSSFVTNILSIYFRFVFCQMRLNKIFHFILLSSDMVNYFNSFIAHKNHTRIYWMDHSYIRPENKIDVEHQIVDNRIKIGIPGAITPSRGLKELKYLLANLRNQNICIYALSTCSEMIESDHFIELNRESRLLPFGQYNAYVKSMDVMLLLYNTNSYKLTASGAILEAIWNEKPIVALNNSYFEYLFKKYGDMGILCDNVKDICEAINDFKTNPLFIRNLINAKAELDPEVVQKQLLKIVNYV